MPHVGNRRGGATGDGARSGDAPLGLLRPVLHLAPADLLGAVSLDLFAVLLGGATALMPIYARDILGTGPWGLGILRAAPAAARSACRW